MCQPSSSTWKLVPFVYERSFDRVIKLWLDVRQLGGVLESPLWKLFCGLTWGQTNRPSQEFLRDLIEAGDQVGGKAQAV